MLKDNKAFSSFLANDILKVEVAQSFVLINRVRSSYC